VLPVSVVILAAGAQDAGTHADDTSAWYSSVPEMTILVLPTKPDLGERRRGVDGETDDETVLFREF
jgi:hypothetical protein